MIQKIGFSVGTLFASCWHKRRIHLNNKIYFRTAHWRHWCSSKLQRVAQWNFPLNGSQYLCSLRGDINNEHNLTGTEAFTNSFSERMQADISSRGNCAHFAVIIRRYQGIVSLSSLHLHNTAETRRQRRTKFLTFIEVPYCVCLPTDLEGLWFFWIGGACIISVGS